MDLLNAGDVIRLREDLSLLQDGVELPKGTKGKIISVDERGYTVIFEGAITPLPTLTDRDVELDPVHSGDLFAQ